MPTSVHKVVTDTEILALFFHICKTKYLTVAFSRKHGDQFALWAHKCNGGPWANTKLPPHDHIPIIHNLRGTPSLDQAMGVSASSLTDGSEF